MMPMTLRDLLPKPPTPDQLDWWFDLQKPAPHQLAGLDAIRSAYKSLAQTVVALTPPGADQSAAIRHLRESMMTAVAAVVCAPKPGKLPEQFRKQSEPQ